MSSEKLKNMGLKITQPRKKIFHVFSENHDKHLSAYDLQHILQETNDHLSLATIYRVLGQFEATGLIVRHDFDDDRSVYELSDTHHHDHIICSECGKVVNFYDEYIDARQKEIATIHHFTIQHYALSIYGVCQDCSQKSTE